MPTFVTDDGVTLAYTDTGGPNPAIVLIAGFCAPATTWVFQQDALVDAGYRVIAWDRRGHGQSESPEHGATMDRHGRDLHDLLDALALENVALIGGSMGASTAWSYVETYGTDRLRAVASIDQTPKMVSDADWPYGFHGLTEATVDGFFDHGIPDTGRGRPTRKSVMPMAKLALRLRGMPRMASPATAPMRALLDDHARRDWRGTIAGAEVPVLMLAARDSQFWPAEHAAAAVVDNPLGRSVVIEDCGHAANLDRPDAVNAALIDFMGRP